MQKTFSSNSTILVSLILVFEMKKLFWGKIDIAPSWIDYDRPVISTFLFFQTYPQRRYKRKKLLLELLLTSIYFTTFHKKNPGVVPALEVNNFANYFSLSRVTKAIELMKADLS